MNVFTDAKEARLALDPRTKMLLVLVTNVIMIGGGFSGVSAVLRPIFAAIPFLLLLVEQKWKTASCYALFVALAVSCELLLLEHTGGLLNLILIIFCGLISRFIPGLMMGYYFVSTTKISEIIASMERMHLPQSIIIPFAVMIRFFPTVGEENAAISDAMRMRGIRLSGGKLMAMLEYRMVPLMMSAVKIGEDLSASALTRGLGAPAKRTNFCQIGFTFCDTVVVACSIVSILLFLFPIGDML